MTLLPTPIAIHTNYTADQQRMIVEIAEGLDGRFAPYDTRSEKAAAEKKIQDAKDAEAKRIADQKAAEEAARIAQEKAAAEAEAQRLAIAAAEAEKARQAAVVIPQVQAPARSFGGSCADWIAAAGISEVGMAQELIRRESGCNPGAVNPSSGACGVAQELPCGKSGCDRMDGACQVRWMNSYVISRYGSWSAAVGFHDRNNWY